MLLRWGGAHLAAERSPSAARADGARRSVAVPNGEGVASGSATRVLKRSCGINLKNFKILHLSLNYGAKNVYYSIQS